MEFQKEQITTVILAGGQSTRMQGKDKGLLIINGQSFVEYIVSQISDETNNIIINSNQNKTKYKALGFSVISDIYPNFQGPLAGIHAALSICQTDYLVTLTCDSPYIPEKCIIQLFNQLHNQNADLCFIKDNNNEYPLMNIMKKSLITSIEKHLDSGHKKVFDWFKTLHHTFLTIPVNTIININDDNDYHQLCQNFPNG